jgi:hypothetical protein
MTTFDDILITSDLHPDQHCQCGHLRRSHCPHCCMCEITGHSCSQFKLCPEHPGVPCWRRTAGRESG